MRRALTALMLITCAGSAQQAPGAEPFNAGAPQDAQQTAYIDRASDSYDAPVAPFAPSTRSTETISGRIVWTGYRLDDALVSTDAVMAGYRERLTGQDFESRLDCANEACGGFDFRFGASILPAPGMLMDARDFRQLTAVRGDGALVSVLISRVLDAIYIQTVSGLPGAEPVPVTPTEAVETAPETVILPQDERALLDQLVLNGHVPVEGLDFGTGGAALSDGSQGAIALLARLLARNADMNVAIVGHSDNEGGLDANIELSRRRADAVREALIAAGVVPERLEARGVGYLAPVASNASPEGRARNRRVELVLR